MSSEIRSCSLTVHRCRKTLVFSWANKGTPQSTEQHGKRAVVSHFDPARYVDHSSIKCRPSSLNPSSGRGYRPSDRRPTRNGLPAVYDPHRIQCSPRSIRGADRPRQACTLASEWFAYPGPEAEQLADVHGPLKKWRARPITSFGQPSSYTFATATGRRRLVGS